MVPKVFVTQPISEAALSRLREVAEVELNPDSTHIITKPELIAALKRNNYLLCLLHDRVDAEIINASPDLKLIASMAITPAGVDVAGGSCSPLRDFSRQPVDPFCRRRSQPQNFGNCRARCDWRSRSATGQGIRYAHPLHETSPTG